MRQVERREVWYQCRHYEKLIVSFSFHLTQCYYLRIFTEAGYIFLFINYDRALRPLRDNFLCHAVGLNTHQWFVISEHKTYDFFEKINI